jgi:hypothetical protein
MSKLLKTLKGYVWWTYERGSVHYDVMVTLILLFIFLGPLKIDFRDKPAARPAHPKEVIAYPDGQGGLVCEVPASAVVSPAAKKGNRGAVVSDLAAAIQPVLGPVSVTKYEPIQDLPGHVAAYRAWITPMPKPIVR